MLPVYRPDVEAAEAAAKNLVKNLVKNNVHLLAKNKNAQNLVHNHANQNVDVELVPLRLAAQNLAAKNALSLATKG